MNTQAFIQPRWSTASFGDNAETSPLELSALQAHLTLCRQSHGHLFALQSLAQGLHGFVASRFLTTLVVLTLLLAVASLFW